MMWRGANHLGGFVPFFKLFELNFCENTLYIGRSPTGRAIRCNLFLPQAQHKKSIFAAIPNAKIAVCF
jgi:hypothetical protein